jgi:hypothetical protein
MVVQAEHFEYHFPSNEEERQMLRQLGEDEPWAVVGQGRAIYQPQEKCYYCGDKLTLPLVMWSGWTEPIWLHPQCAHELGTHLIGDAVKAKAA